MPYKEVQPGVHLWYGKMTKAEELEFMTRMAGVRMFPSVNTRSQTQAPVAETKATEQPSPQPANPPPDLRFAL